MGAGASSMATVYGGASNITFNSDYSMGDELPTKRRKIEREKQAPSENSIGFKLPVGATGKGSAISRVRNKCKRTQLYQEAKHVAKKHASKVRRKRQKEHALLGDDAPPKQEPRTLDNTREADDTVVDGDDEEVAGDENMDEFASYFNSDIPPKIMITSNFAKRPSVFCHTFIDDLKGVFPNSAYYKRGTHEVKKIVKLANERKFTDIMVITEKQKTPNGLTLIHLPNGPTATSSSRASCMPKMYLTTPDLQTTSRS